MHIRKIFTVTEDIYSEADRETDAPLRKVAVVAVVKNPYAGKLYQEDLQPLVNESKGLGETITKMAVAAMAPYKVESYGKGAVIGLAGEQEHAAAMLTTVYGNVMREAIGGGKAWVSSFTKKAAAGSTIDIPLAHKDALYVRSHYDGMSLTLPDAPLPDELAIICVYANRGRLNARVGGINASEIKGQDGLV